MKIGNNLSKFIEGQIEMEEQRKVLLIDGHNLIYRTVFVANYQDPEDHEFEYWKHLMMNSILHNIKHFSPNRVVFAMDSHSSTNWRKKVYPLYKAHRKELRDKSSIDFDKFFEVSNKFMDGLATAFPNILFVTVETCEADDIIAVYCNKLLKGERGIIISTDKDMNQLLKNKNVEQWDPLKRAYKKSLDPTADLSIKILTGDPGDNIPAVKKKCGVKTAAKIIKNGLDDFLLITENKKNYIRNKTLIDLDCIPKTAVSKIEKAITNYKVGEYNGTKAWGFLLSNKVRKIADDLQMFSTHLKKLS